MFKIINREKMMSKRMETKWIEGRETKDCNKEVTRGSPNILMIKKLVDMAIVRMILSQDPNTTSQEITDTGEEADKMDHQKNTDILLEAEETLEVIEMIETKEEID